MAKPVCMFVVGTRPDAIKTAPVVLEFQKHAADVESLLLSTGQHKEMLQQVFDTFGLAPDVDLQVMRDQQSLAHITSRILEGLDGVFADRAPDVVFAQGDTQIVSFSTSLKFSDTHHSSQSPFIDIKTPGGL